MEAQPSDGLPATEPRRPFQILCLDGGGLKGLFSAVVLAELENDLGVDLLDHFDLVAGTSAGGIIALAFGKGLSAAEIVDFYGQLGTSVFSEPRRLPLRSAKHQAPKLRAALDSVFGDTLLGASRVPLVIPSFSLDAQSVYIFKTPHHKRLKRDWKVPMAEVAMATSAAPTFLPAFRLGSTRLIDGGVWANNPVLVAIAEARSLLGASLDDVRILSLGTTTEVKAMPASLDKGGLIPWGLKGRSILLDAPAAGTHTTAGHLIGLDRIHRMDAAVAAGQFKLDRADDGLLRGLAHEVSRHHAPTVEVFLEHTPPAYTPFHIEGDHR